MYKGSYKIEAYSVCTWYHPKYTPYPSMPATRNLADQILERMGVGNSAHTSIPAHLLL